MKATYVASAALVALVNAQNTATSTSDVYAAQATAKTDHSTSYVCGHAFDRIAIIWLENTDYDKAVGDRTFILQEYCLTLHEVAS